MKMIFKYTLTPDDAVTLKVPCVFEPLTVQMQHGEPRLWALVDPESPMTSRRFRVFGTGHSVPNEIRREDYIGTFQIAAGDLVFHVFAEHIS